MKKLYLLLLVVLSWNSFSQGIPPPPACHVFKSIDNDNDGFTTFDINSYIIFFRSYASQRGFNLAAYTIRLYTAGSGLITSSTYTNVIQYEEYSEFEFIYNGSGIQYNMNDLLYNFACQYLGTIPQNGDFDGDGIINSLENLNNNSSLYDENTDGDIFPNYLDNDDDDDGILTINEDYNNNGSVLDDDMNSNGINDYLDNLARGTLNLNLKLFIEGYYSGSSMMQSVKFNQDGSSPTTDVENITVELHSTTAPFSLVASTISLLKTNGTAICSFASASVGSYYITVKSRSGLQTWSATPQSLITTILTYDFSSAANKAFGGNMKNLGNGVFGFYSGDINQDESIDATDAVDLTNDIVASAFGNKTTDLNGDGSVDASDAPLFENNSSFSIYTMRP